MTDLHLQVKLQQGQYKQHNLIQTLPMDRQRQHYRMSVERTPLTIAFDKFDKDDVTDNILATVEEVSGGEYFYIFPSRDTEIEELKNAHPKISESIVDDKNAETIYDVLQSLYENGFDAINIVVRQSRAKEISEPALKANGQLYNYIMMNVIPVDERTIREQYLAGDIFKNGSMIESHSRVDRSFRRGANHLICVDENKETSEHGYQRQKK